MPVPWTVHIDTQTAALSDITLEPEKGRDLQYSKADVARICSTRSAWASKSNPARPASYVRMAGRCPLFSCHLVPFSLTRLNRAYFALERVYRAKF